MVNIFSNNISINFLHIFLRRHFFLHVYIKSFLLKRDESVKAFSHLVLKMQQPF